MKKKPTTIRAFRAIWKVPRGFGRIYRDVARDHMELLAKGKPGKIVAAICDTLELVGYTASAETIAEWNAQKRVEAFVWAATEHACASDNPVRRHPHPTWLKKIVPWCGPPADTSHIRADLRGVFDGPTPTEIM